MTIGTRETILQRIGVAVREHRLRKNITQKMLAERSGISLTAVKHLERGVGATLGSFVQACRTLGIDGWIAEIEPRDELRDNPSEEAKHLYAVATCGVKVSF